MSDKLTAEEVQSIRDESAKMYPYMKWDDDFAFTHNSIQAGKRIGYEECLTSEREKVKPLLEEKDEEIVSLKRQVADLKQQMFSLKYAIKSGRYRR